MKKIFAIAAREFNAVVRTKAFVIGLVLLPVMMALPGLMMRLTRGVNDVRDRRFAVIDRTGGAFTGALAAAVDKRNETATLDKASGRQTQPRFVLESIRPAGDGAESGAALRQRFELAERVRRGELFGFIDVGRDVLPSTKPVTITADAAAMTLRTEPADATADAPSQSSAQSSAQSILYYTNTPTYGDFRNLVETAANQAALKRRLAAHGLSPDVFAELQQRVSVRDEGLPRMTAQGTITESKAPNRIVSFLAPFGLAMLMFVVVLIGAMPMMQGIMEEKQQRISEVLLGSVRPFDLMAGKVIGLLATSLLLIGVYLAGAYYAAHRMGFADYLSPRLIAWFVLFQVLAVLMFGSLFIALGAACNDLKEMQSLLMPVNLLLIVPIALLPNVIENPNGPLARIASLIPPIAPMVMVARLAVPPGVPAWEIALSVGLVLAATVLFVWASGRVFRVGILMQGKGANLRDLMRWVATG